MKVHLIEKSDNFRKLEDETWESSGWNLDEDTANKLIGGEVYFHRKKEEASFYGGTIMGYRIEQEGDHQGLIVLQLQPCNTCRNVRTDKYGWSTGVKVIENG